MTTPHLNYDTRWSPGSSGIDAPDNVVAHYAGRWIDRGGMRPADVVEDRQGIAYTHEQYAVLLTGELTRRAPHCSVSTIERDVPTVLWDEAISGDGLRITIGVRRSGGYAYCDAYLTKEQR